MRILTLACVAATLAMSPALAADYFPWAGYAWRPTVSYRDYYAYQYTYYYPRAVAPDGRYWSRPHRRYSWRR
jgi:hypothetical protein